MPRGRCPYFSDQINLDLVAGRVLKWGMFRWSVLNNCVMGIHPSIFLSLYVQVDTLTQGNKALHAQVGVLVHDM